MPKQETIIIPSNDLTTDELLSFLKDKANKVEEIKGNLELTFEDTVLVLNHEQRKNISFIKSMMMALILRSHDIDFNAITTHKLK